jgi:probable phosphoglycerate mutase
VKSDILMAMKQGLFPYPQTVILHSPLSRAQQSAQIGHEVLNPKVMRMEEDLRERFFGELDGKTSDRYLRVWQIDHILPDHHAYGSESPKDVVERMLRVITIAEETYERMNVLLVSHGDPLHILETAFRKRPVSEHRDLPEWKNGEIRKLS